MPALVPLMTPYCISNFKWVSLVIPRLGYVRGTIVKWNLDRMKVCYTYGHPYNLFVSRNVNEMRWFLITKCTMYFHPAPIYLYYTILLVKDVKQSTVHNSGYFKMISYSLPSYNEVYIYILSWHKKKNNGNHLSKSNLRSFQVASIRA